MHDEGVSISELGKLKIRGFAGEYVQGAFVVFVEGLPNFAK